jgi:hypothetical protein
MVHDGVTAAIAGGRLMPSAFAYASAFCLVR